MTTEDANARTHAARKRMQIFRARDAKPLDEDMMPQEAPNARDAASLAKLYAAGLSASAGASSLVLFREPGETGMSLVHIWFKSGYVLPRHSHDSDCLYCVIAGELRIGAHVLRKGDGMFIPAGHPYGYEAGPEGVEVLEFRNATQFNFVLGGNNAPYWERIGEVFRTRAQIWEHEKAPSAT